ncbi:hypothetical protein ACFV19_26215 [Streptomyces griseoluteus]|uniref:hypothetical protein n=1 Tax=Streptomyces griseoluteus TaxID=29306 RepID=UPI0036AF88D2
MSNETGAGRRHTRRSYEAMEAETFALELEADGAYVSPGRVPWRGLCGTDPYEAMSDDEHFQRAFEDWEDAGLDEDERPQRRRPSGRAMDITPPYSAPVITRTDPEIARRFAESQARAEAGASWPVDGGTVTVVGALKVWRGQCAQCGSDFEQTRPGDQRRRWKKTCSEVCAAGWKRDRATERKRRQRSDAA